MLLRSLTQHIKEQNWFAVILDFVIVVVGVGVALYAQQWLVDRDQRANYERALVGIQADLESLHLTWTERLAIEPCRKARYRRIGLQLTRTDQPWTNDLAVNFVDDAALDTLFPRVTRSPFRDWRSPSWEAEIGRGTLDLMTDNDRQALSFVLTIAAPIAEQLQSEIAAKEASLQALAVPLKLSVSDRLRYYDTLNQLDSSNSILESSASYSMGLLKATQLWNSDKVDRDAIRAAAETAHANTVRIYGDCVTPVNTETFWETAE